MDALYMIAGGLVGVGIFLLLVLRGCRFLHTVDVDTITSYRKFFIELKKSRTHNAKG